jgi:hypothetical protein
MSINIFNATLSPAAYTTNQEISLALGSTTLVLFSVTVASLSIFGLSVPGGNIDGMVVCLRNGGSQGAVFPHESTSASALVNRFNNANLTSVAIVPNGVIWYRFNALAARWQHIGKA